MALVCMLAVPATALAQKETLPVLTQPVNDFAGIVDPASTREIDRLSRALQATTGDTIVVVTTKSVAPYGDIRDYANDLFQNQGKGIGEKGKDNGLLIVVSVSERKVWCEVGYGLEGIITDGFAGETSRQQMTPYFRQGQYGTGLLAGVRTFATRIAESKNVKLSDLQLPQPVRQAPSGTNLTWLIILIVILIIMWSSSRGGPGASFRRRRGVYWGGGPWSGWGGGGFGGGFGGGGGFSGGGFGGFGGGSSGGGGGGASW